MTNAELEDAARLFSKHGRGYQLEVERIEELLDRRREMGYDPQPKPDPEADAERERRRKRAAEFIEKLNKEGSADA